MARFSQRFIRSVVRLVWNQAEAGANSFRDALNACQSGQWTYVGTGWTVQSSSGAGYSTSFHIPQDPNDPVAMTPAALQELFENLLEVYALVVSEGTNEDVGDIDAMNSVFVAQMWAHFPTIKGTTNNWMYMTP